VKNEKLEIKNELPNGWVETTLGNITYQISNKIVPQQNSKEKFIGMDCIEKDCYKPHFLYDFKDFKSAGNIFTKGNILYGRLRPYLNKVYKAEFDGVASGEFIIIDTSEDVSNQFLKYILHSSKFVHWSNSLSSGDKPRVKYNQLCNYNLKLPPLNEQKRIVAKIEKLFSNLDNSDKYLVHLEKQLKRYRQSVLKSAFEGELPYKYVKTKLSNVVMQISIKKMPNDCPESPFIGMDCIEKNTLKPYFTYKFQEFKSAGNEFLCGNLLYGRLRPYLNKVYLAEYDGIASGEFIILKINTDISGDYIKYLLHSQEFVIWSNAQATGDKPRVKYNQIGKYEFFIPKTLEEQIKVVNQIEKHFSIIDKLETVVQQSIKESKRLRQSVLKQAFEGKLVGQDQNDESASVLLQKIAKAKEEYQKAMRKKK